MRKLNLSKESKISTNMVIYLMIITLIVSFIGVGVLGSYTYNLYEKVLNAFFNVFKALIKY